MPAFVIQLVELVLELCFFLFLKVVAVLLELLVVKLKQVTQLYIDMGLLAGLMVKHRQLLRRQDLILDLARFDCVFVNLMSRGFFI
jgi:hypothetical protein